MKRIAMYMRATKTKKYKLLFWLITLPLMPIGLINAVLILLGEFAEKVNYWLMDMRSSVIERVFLFFKWDGVEIVEEDDE